MRDRDRAKVERPDQVGRPIDRGKNIRKATPRQISGTMIGSEIVPSTAPLSGKRNRHSITAAKVPMTRLASVASAAMVSELTSASTSASLAIAFS